MMSIIGKGKQIFLFFFSPQKPSWALNQNNQHNVFAFELEGWGKKARKYYLVTSFSCGDTQHLKGLRAAFVQGRCCCVDVPRLVGKQFQEVSIPQVLC